MPQKEVQINGKWYWTLEQTGIVQIFPNKPDAFMWSEDEIQEDKILEIKTLIVCFGKNKWMRSASFLADDGVMAEHCALFASEHEKKSRRATNIEVMRWCSTNGVWLDEYNQVRNDPLDAKLSELKNPCKECVVKVVKWDGETMEPTAKNMGLPELK
jgi:hypothetical protein